MRRANRMSMGTGWRKSGAHSGFKHSLEGPKREKKQGQEPARCEWRYDTTERGYNCGKKGLHKPATFPVILLFPIPSISTCLCAPIPTIGRSHAPRICAANILPSANINSTHLCMYENLPLPNAQKNQRCKI